MNTIISVINNGENVEQFVNNSVRNAEYPFIYKRGDKFTDMLFAFLVGFLQKGITEDGGYDYHDFLTHYVAAEWRWESKEEELDIPINTKYGDLRISQIQVMLGYDGVFRTIFYQSPESADVDGEDVGINDITNPLDVMEWITKNLYTED